MRSKRWRVRVSALLLVLWIPQAHATSVSPIQVELASAGAKARSQVTASNTGQAPLALEAIVQRIDLDEAGKQTLSRAGDDFLIFPPQAMVPPGGTQVFRVEWLGGPDLAQSKSYQLTLSQIPVKTGKNQSVVQVVMSFGVIINVAPAQGSAQVKVIGTGVATGEKPGMRLPTITVENSGKAHALLKDATIRLSNGGWSQTLSSHDFNQKVGMGLVQPGKRRKFTLPIELPANITNFQAEVDYRPKPL
jgi:fimbrial chaperone protein